MIDLTQKNTRTLEVKIADKKVKLEPPKIKTIKKLLNISSKLSEGTDPEQQIDELIDMIAKLLSKNSKDIEVTPKEVEEKLDFDTMVVFLNDYLNWVSEIKSDPN